VKRILLLIVALTGLCAGSLFAQNAITDSTEYKEMMRFKALYDQAYQDGDYEKALEYAREVKTWSDKVNALADAELERRRNANNNTITDTTVTETEEQRWLRIKDAVTIEMADRRSEFEGLHADRIAPDEYAALNEKIDRLLALLEDQGSLGEAEALYGEITADADALQMIIRDKTDKVRSLMARARESLDFAVSADAGALAPEELATAQAAYPSGEAFYNDFYYDSAITEFEKTIYFAEGALMVSVRLQQIATTDEKLASSRATIEGYSRVMVSDEKGKVYLSDAWSGEAYLAEHPLSNLTVELEPFTAGDTSPELMPVALDAASAPEMKEQETALETSVRLWMMGVNARNIGELDLANEYFNQAVVFAETYRTSAATVVYKVKKLDCLWNIAKKLYGNPFFWPLIFKANEEKIENPSLIYPGQEFLIPNP
jgi:nucleoid-associated protein YgaU